MLPKDLLIDSYRRINQAMVEKDIETLENIISKDSVLFHMTGYVQPLVEWLCDIANDQMIYNSSQFVSATVRDLDNKKMLVIGRSYVVASIWGSRMHKWPLEIKMTFEEINGKWHVTNQLASTF